MNREQKIALIIGFAVILVVGVLVSDHWSQARRVELVDATEGVGDVLQGRPFASLPNPAHVQLAPTRLAEDPAGPAAQAPNPTEVAGATPEAPHEVLNLLQGGVNSDLASAMSNRIGEAEPEDSGSSWMKDFTDLTQQIAEGAGLREAARVDGSIESARPAPGAEGVRPAPTGPGAPDVVGASAPIRHKVQKNETLFAIAKKYYGDGNKWRKIADANPGVVREGGHIEPGVTLVVPDAGARTPQQTPEKKAAEPRRETRLAEGAKPVQYTVQKNDTLGRIAQRFLGTSKRTGDIIAANRGRISDPNDIRAGMVLNIPGK